jgi:hypothetical protein
MTTNTLGAINMKPQSTDTPQRQAALSAGLGLLIMAIIAFFANFFALENLVVPEDAAKTVSNIMANEMLFRFGLIGFIIVLSCDVLVAWALYLFLKPVNQSLSLLAAVFRLVYTAIFGAALLNLANVLSLLSGAEAFTSEQLQIQVMMSLESFHNGWLIGLAFFGIHLLVLGYVVLKSSYVPKVLGVLLIAASLGYIIDSSAHFLLSNYADYETLFSLIVAVPGMIGELSLCFWLLLRGVRVQGQAPNLQDKHFNNGL